MYFRIVEIARVPSCTNIENDRLPEVAADLRNISYSDSEYEYRHVQLPKAMLKAIPKDYHDPSKGTLKLLWEDEWRALGITQVRPVATTTNIPRGGGAR